jgi:hypothetical protein
MVTRMKHPATQLLQPVTTGLTVAYLYGSPPLLALTLRALAKRLVAGFRRIGKRFTNGRQGAGQGGESHIERGVSMALIAAWVRRRARELSRTRSTRFVISFGRAPTPTDEISTFTSRCDQALTEPRAGGRGSNRGS